MIYVILRVLNDPLRNNHSVQEGINEWKVYVYQFAGLFLKKNHNSCLDCIFAYLVNKLVNDDVSHLPMLRDVIGKMTGFEYIENLNYDQLMS